MPDHSPRPSCFKAYDIRGRVPEELDADLAYRIGRAYADVLKPKQVAVGYDIRLTSPKLAKSLSQGLMDAGVDVLDIGLCGTEEIYFATSHYDLDGGIMVTASHNPQAYNGMKMVGKEARPIGRNNGLNEIEAQVYQQDDTNDESVSSGRGKTEKLAHRNAYIEHLLSYVDLTNIPTLKIVTDAGNGGAGMIVDALEPHLPVEFIKLGNEPDGHFPRGVPNPLLPENRSDIIKTIKETGADLGIAWDGDFDRCFLFDEHGTFVEGYYIVGLLAEAFLSKHPGSNIIHDPRLTWNTVEVVETAGGQPIQSRTGHAFIKDAMREHNAVYGGEMSGHHYFRDFGYCDSGMIPWMLVLEMIGVTGKSLSELMGERMRTYPCSGEINFHVASTEDAIQTVRETFTTDAIGMDETDGLSLIFNDWRFNLRGSNTEPVLRLNIESRGDAERVAQATAKFEELLRNKT